MVDLMKAIFTVRNHTQEVGYRAFLTSKFPEFNLKGTAINMPDGKTVKVRVQGTEESIKTFNEYLKTHFPLAIQLSETIDKSKIEVSEPKFDETLEIGNSTEHNQSLILEQLDKGVGYQALTLQTMKKGFSEMKGGFSGLRGETRKGFSKLSHKLDALPGRIAKAIKR